jgi:gas vesicle protein
MAKTNRVGTFIGGMLLGGAVGTVVGLLVAPRTGKETRKIVQKSVSAVPEMVEDLAGTIQLQSHRLSEASLRNWEGTLTRLREAIAAGIVATQQETAENSSNAPKNSAVLSPTTIDRHS